jgi:cytoskeletal protein RodZ
MGISRFFQFALGFILGIALVAGGAIGIGYMVLTRMSVTPPKPVFSEEQAPTKQQSQEPVTAQKNPETESQVNQTQTAESAESAPQEVEETLPPGAYKAIVTYPQGLSMRSEPNADADRIGSVLVNQEIIILQNSDDRKWQKIRIPKSDREGWVKAGNIRKI